MEIDRAVLTAASAILGSLVGGSATIATAWLTQRTQGRRQSVEAEVRKREALHADFIAEGSKLVVDSLDHELDRPESLYALYAVLNRIRLVSSDDVLAAADRTATRIVERYFRPKPFPEELRQHLLTRPDDPLKEFSGACRLELWTLQRRG